MLTYTEKICSFDTYHEALSYAPSDCLFFDIETTGFSAASSMLFLVGAVRYEEGEWMLTQWLAQGPDDEECVLQAFLELAGSFTTLIHFNGQTFDLPYINAKASAYGLSPVPDSVHSLDLYQKFRPLKKLLGLKHMNQTVLESYIGWKRTDCLTGKHMISLFQKYTAANDPGLRDLLLLHNHDDLCGMTQVLSLAAFLMLFEGEIEDAAIDKPDPDKVWNPLPESVSVPHDIAGLSSVVPVRISFCLKKALPAPLSLEAPFLLSVSRKTGTLTVPAVLGELKYFFPDYRNYYYLPLEDQAIHKSVAAYVAKEYRIPAKPDTCCTKKNGLFLPQPGAVFTPVFQSALHSPMRYFLWSDTLLSDRDAQIRYARSLLAAFL